MSENLVLEMLQAIQGDIGQIRGDLLEVKERLSFLEGAYDSLSRRIDCVAGDVERIKVRLDIVDAPTP